MLQTADREQREQASCGAIETVVKIAEQGSVSAKQVAFQTK